MHQIAYFKSNFPKKSQPMGGCPPDPPWPDHFSKAGDGPVGIVHKL